MKHDWILDVLTDLPVDVSDERALVSLLVILCGTKQDEFIVFDKGMNLTQVAFRDGFVDQFIEAAHTAFQARVSSRERF